MSNVGITDQKMNPVRGLNVYKNNYTIGTDHGQNDYLLYNCTDTEGVLPLTG